MSEQSHKTAIITGIATVLAAIITVTGAYLMRPAEKQDPVPTNEVLVVPPTNTPAAEADRDQIRKQEITASIQQMITLLEASEYRAFVDRAFDPEVKATMLKEMPLEDIVRSLSGGGGERFLTMLRHVRAKQPTLTGETTALLPVDSDVSPQLKNLTAIYLIKRNNVWYLRDRP